MDIHKMKLEKFNTIVVENKPENVDLEFEYLDNAEDMDCYITFLFSIEDLEKTMRKVESLPENEKRQLYFIYPKKTSKNYKTTINRDTLIKPIKEDGHYVAPRMMSLSDDFTIASFRFKK